ncbi:MAG: class I SAM-dependent methyltransferase [Sandaracinaceae bacterium]
MDDETDRVSQLFDGWAEAGRAEGMERGHEHAARAAFERLGIEPGARYLDVGCGNGYAVRWAADVDPSVQAFGIDVSAKMIERARERSPQPNARFIHAPFPLPMLKAKSFATVLSVETLYYLPDLTWGLVSVGRLLEPGGRFACVVDYYEENAASHGWPEELGLEMKRLSAAGWRAAMEEVGLQVIDQTRIRRPLADGETPGWAQSEGSLLTLAMRPR